MKILVFSDSHRFLSGMVQAIEEEKPDQVIHLGDLMSDAEELSWRFQTLPICMVPGNCDGWTTAPAGSPSRGRTSCCPTATCGG